MKSNSTDVSSPNQMMQQARRVCLENGVIVPAQFEHWHRFYRTQYMAASDFISWTDELKRTKRPPALPEPEIHPDEPIKGTGSHDGFRLEVETTCGQRFNPRNQKSFKTWSGGDWGYKSKPAGNWAQYSNPRIDKPSGQSGVRHAIS